MTYYATNEITGTTTAAALTGQQVLRRSSVVASAAGDVLSVTGSIIFASGVNLAINSIVELVVLPADHVPIDFILVNDDFDSATTITVKLGVMTGLVGDAGRALATVGVEGLASGATTLQAAAFSRNALAAWYRMAPASADRSIGLGVVAAPTDPATIRQLDFTMLYRWSRYGV